MFGFSIRRSGVPLVYWMHNDVKTRNKNIWELIASHQKPELVIANSEFTAASLPLHFARIPPHVVIPCPVTRPRRPFLTPEQRAQIRAQLKTPPEAVVIVLAGRPEAWKGHALLLEALDQLRMLPDWHCWIIGGAFDAQQAAFLETLRVTAPRDLRIADRVQILGQRQDVPDLLLAADVFCQPNQTPEPFGIVFIEALYAGLPVISVDHGGAKEILDDSCGRLVKPGDAAGLAAVLEELICHTDQRSALSRNAPLRGAAISDPARVLPRVHQQLSLLQRSTEPAVLGASPCPQ